MSIVFVPKRLRGKAKINQETIQRLGLVHAEHQHPFRAVLCGNIWCCTQWLELLDENDQLIRCIAEYQQKGRAAECVQYQQILHRNIVYLATIADASSMPPSTHPTSNESSASTPTVNGPRAT